MKSGFVSKVFKIKLINYYWQETTYQVSIKQTYKVTIIEYTALFMYNTVFLKRPLSFKNVTQLEITCQLLSFSIFAFSCDVKSRYVGANI